MSDQKANPGRYLYAVIAGNETRDFGPLGVNDGTVYTLVNGEMAAVVSDVPNRRIRPERRFLAAHNAVLQRLMKETTPLPLSFGIIADSPEEVPRILTRNRKILVDQLQRVDGKVEMGLRVSWSVPNVFEYFVLTHTELRMARDRFFGGPREPSHEDKIELGRMFDRLLTEDREEHSEKVETILSDSSFEIKRNRCRNEQEVMNLACLVGRNSQADFEEAVFEAAGLFNNDYTFDFNGPWAPHNFVDVELQL